MKKLAVFLLVAGLWSQEGWRLFDADIDVQGAVWNISQQALIVSILAMLALTSRSIAMASVCFILSLFAGLSIFCDLAWLIAPWVRKAGEGQCSQRFHIPLDAIEVGAGATLLYQMVRDGRSRS